jgi:adenine-specific DNA-methyltransferase
VPEETIESLKRQINRLKQAVKKQKYGLIWMDVPEAFEDDVENKLPVLKELPELSIKNSDGKPTHILIVGDNYHALTCLNYTHKGKIDLIYIDPPYNTGSDGFRYKDKRIIDRFPDGTEVPKDHPFRHSYWLSFMKKRLQLARNLLKESGFILINIDDNEGAQLKLLCDEIFGESNFVTPIYVQVRYPGKTLVEDMDVQKIIEMVYVYAKSNKATLNKEKEDYNFDKFCWSIKETSKPFKTLTFGGKKVELFREGTYKIAEVAPDKNLFKEIWATGKILDGNSSGRFFRDYLTGRMKEDGYNVLYKVYDIGGDQFNFRYFTGPKRVGATKGKYYQGVPTDVLENKENNNIFKPIINFVNFADNFGNCRHEGGVEFRSGKKPVPYLKYLFKLALKEQKDNIVLDFFAGSGSTAHAVFEINEEMKRNNQVILVTNNESDIFTQITYKRLKNIIKGINEGQRFGNSLKCYKTDFIGKNNISKATDQDKIELAHNAGELLAIAENTLDLVTQNSHFQLYRSNDKFTAIYFREELNEFEKFVKMLEGLDKRIMTYVFSWGNEEFADDFSAVRDFQLKTIPRPILEIYKNIYNLS